MRQESKWNHKLYSWATNNIYIYKSKETTFGNSVLVGDRRELSSCQYLISEYPVCLHSKNCCITKMCLMLPYFWIMVWLLTIDIKLTNKFDQNVLVLVIKF